MKKHHKLNLDELADQMEGTSRQEQESSSGGHYYYLPSGKELGQRGPGQEIRIVQEEWQFHAFGGSESSLNDYSTLLCYAGADTQRTILSSIAGHDVQVYSVALPGENINTSQARCTEQGQMGINYYGSVYRNGNYWDIRSALRVHEGTHYGQIGADLTIEQRELLAYRAQLLDPYFNNCSPEFRHIIVMNYQLYS